MAFYSTQCEACTDASKRAVQPKGGQDGQLPQMYECGNEECKLNIARQKGIRQLQSLRGGDPQEQERDAARRPARKDTGGSDRRGRRERKR